MAILKPIIGPANPLTVASLSLAFIAISLLVFVLHVGQPIVMPFVIAVFLWYLINALARAIGCIKIGGNALPRSYRFAFAIIFFLLLFGIIGTLISSNIMNIIKDAPEYQASLENLAGKMLGFLPLDHQPTFSDLREYLDLGKIVTSLATLFTGLAGKTLIVVIYTGFLLYEQKFFNHKIITMIEDQETEDHVRAIFHKIDMRIQRYIGIKSLNSAFDSIMTYLILSFVGLEHAAFWGVLAFFLHFIPYAGSLMAITIPAMIALVQFGDPMYFFIVAAGIGAVHAFIGHFLEPVMMGENLNLSPIFIITSLAMWGLIWGIPGMFLAVPILAILVISLSQFPRTRPWAILMSKNGNLAE